MSVTLPNVDKIPTVRFDEAKRKVAEKYGRKIRNPYDLEPEEEALIGQYFKEECDADFVFVTHYPSKKRPFYAMDDPADPTFTLSFDLLYPRSGDHDRRTAYPRLQRCCWKKSKNAA